MPPISSRRIRFGEALRDDCAGRVVNDRVPGLPAGLEREVEARERELDADHIRRENAQGLLEQFLPGLVPFEHHDRFVLHPSGH